MKMRARQLVRFEFLRLESLRLQFWRVAPVVAGLVALPVVSPANEAGVLAVDVKCRERVCEFAVTLQHEDEGWGHYADAWEVLSLDRVLLAKRVLRHPHVEEQPFTRSLPGVVLPAGTRSVIVRGHDKVHGYGGAELRVEIPEEGKAADKGKGSERPVE